MRGAMLAGGAAVAYHAGKSHQAGAQREDDQDQQIDELSQQQEQQPQQGYAQAPTQAPAPPSDDTVTELERLKSLLDSGALTQDEFNAAKQKVLGI